MPEITYPIRINVLRDAIARTHKVGAYQAREWLESYMTFLEIQENDRSDTDTTRDTTTDDASS